MANEAPAPPARPRRGGGGPALAAAVAAAALGCSSRPAGDPDAFTKIALAMIENIPTPGGAPECTGEQVVGGATMSMRTVLQIARRSYPDNPQFADYVHPPELDVPAARVLADPKSSEDDRRRAAAELATAPFYLAYMIDHVNVPMALGVKELKLGVASARALRYDKQGRIECVRVFQWYNDDAVSESAIRRSDKPRMDPAIVKLLQDDLRVQLLKRVSVLHLPPPPGKAGKKPLEP